MSSDRRSTVEHHPLVNQDGDDFGTPRSPGASGAGTPETGYIMDTDLTGLRTEYQDPPDPALSLLEVPNTNWTRSGVGASSSSYTELVPYDKGLNSRLLCAILAVALGSAFQHGYNLGVINAPLELMGDWLNTTNYNRTEEYLTQSSKTMIISWIVSIYCIGGMIGGAFTGFFSERFGRKGGLLINNVFAFLAAILFGFCKMAGSWEMIVAGRFFIGINNGLNAGLAPMYLSEIAPTNLRGAIGTVYQLAVTISILFSQIMGLESILGSESLWPIMLALTAGPAVFQLCVLPICPESPKYLLINKGKQVDSQRALQWLRDSTNVHDEMEEMQSEAEAQKLVPTVSVREIITNPTLRIPLVISLMMMLAQQLSGINAVIFFSTKIYESAGLSEAASLYATIAMGAMNVAMTLISLVMVEKAGRKTLMLTGLTGMMIVSLLLTICLALKDHGTWISYFSIVLVISFVVMFATGPGSIPWFLVNEVFASNARPIAASIAVAVNWTAAFLVGLLFLPIAEVMGPYVFLVFVVLLAFFILFTWKKVPETKGRSIDEITAIFKQQAYGSGSGNLV
ncbi:solute carrier family 2, facilitated glucose transporter member 1 isoform X2 [Hyalella azteca]|uniref:Solute carrier family 2, facilitated glucose transporter member 1 isoform X2 n=1 Tax=Hyalella azteca TaxID=294128 RepID=A0A8B7NZ96_HYAAZ|nr:solute carrier family 2, facilitated glucose transporter member 1 isoform X2 [Hyalella azteca]